MSKDIQSIQLFYEDGTSGMLSYIIRPNYRTSSMGVDVEDELIKEYTKEIQGVNIDIKEYFVDIDHLTRWTVEFAYLDVQYSLVIVDIKEGEVEKIVENLFFS